MAFRSVLFASALAALSLGACNKETTSNPAPAPAAPSAAQPAPAVTSPAAPAGADAAARNYPKVDPATLTDASSTTDVHNALIRPGYDRLTDAENKAPSTDADWKAAADGAAMVTKGASLLAKGSRPPKGEADWVKFANAVVEKTKVTADHITKKDADDLVFSDGDVQEQCTNCHSKYRH